MTSAHLPQQISTVLDDTLPIRLSFLNIVVSTILNDCMQKMFLLFAIGTVL